MNNSAEGIASEGGLSKEPNPQDRHADAPSAAAVLARCRTPGADERQLSLLRSLAEQAGLPTPHVTTRRAASKRIEELISMVHRCRGAGIIG